MTQPFQYDPSQQPGQPSQPYDPAQQHGQPYDPAQQPGQPYDPSQQHAAPFDPAQPPPPLDPAGHQPPAFDPGQAAAQPFGPSSEPPMFLPPSGNFLPPEPKKSKGGLFIVLGIVVLLLIGGGIGVAIWRPWAPASDTTDKADSSKEDDAKDEGKNDGDKDEEGEDSEEGVPSQVVDDAWHAQDWDQAKGYMCETLVKELEDNGAAENYKPIGTDEEFKTTGEEIKDDEATVSVETTVKSASGKPEIGKLEVGLVKEKSDWKICEINDKA